MRKALAIIIFLGSYAPFSSADIKYEIEACCTLCPEINDIESYNTRYLKTNIQLVEGADGWLYRSTLDLDEEFELSEDTLVELKRFRKALEARGTKLLMVYNPTRGLINSGSVIANSTKNYDFDAAAESYNRALQQIRNTGIIVPELSTLISNEGNPSFYFRRDAHWTPNGAMLTAQVVADKVKTLDFFSAIPNEKFITKRSGMLNIRGTHQKAAYLICGLEYPYQYVDEFNTEPVEENEASLFGESDLPSIVVAGTSFSNGVTNYNFVGYLKEFLSVDVLNVAQSGGGKIGSLLQYLASDDFQENPPKLLIWEIPAYTSLDSTFGYRELIPLVNNGCANQSNALSRTTKLKNGMNEVLFNGGGEVKLLYGKDYLLDIQFNSPDINRLNATIWYHNSRKERINLKRLSRVNTEGRFVFELRAKGEWKDFIFTSLDLEVYDSYPENLEVTATMCHRNDSNL